MGGREESSNRGESQGDGRRGSRRRAAQKGNKGRGGQNGGRRNGRASPRDTDVLVKFRALLEAGNPRAVEAHRRFEEVHQQMDTFLLEARELLSSGSTTPTVNPHEYGEPADSAKTTPEQPGPAPLRPPPGLGAAKESLRTLFLKDDPRPPPGLSLAGSGPPGIVLKKTQLPEPPPGMTKKDKIVEPPPGMLQKNAPPPGMRQPVPPPMPPTPQPELEEQDDAALSDHAQGAMLQEQPLSKRKDAVTRKRVDGNARLLVRPHSPLKRVDGVIVLKPKAKLDLDWEKEGGRCAVGLFRLGAPTNEAAIVTKVPRQRSSSRGRLPFFAPRSAGIFVFRLLSEAKNGRFGPETLATSTPFEVVVGAAELAESVAQNLQQMQESPRSRLSAALQLTHVLSHLDVKQYVVSSLDAATIARVSNDVSKCLEYALDLLEESAMPGPHSVAARRRAGELTASAGTPPDDEEEQRKEAKKRLLEARRATETQLTTHKLVDAALGNSRCLLSSDTLRRAEARQATWCEVVEEYWDDEDALARHRARGGSYVEITTVDSAAASFAATALESAARRTLPSLVPSQAFFELRLAARQRVEAALREELDAPSLTLRVFGSSANLFGAEGADLDMCAEVAGARYLDEQARRDLVIRVGEALRARSLSFANLQIREGARVPIALFTDTVSGLDCDVSTHNPLALRNTSLLRAYASIDQRVRAVAYVVKSWAKARSINSPVNGTLSSYGFVLCVLHYLQTRPKPPILPSLQLLPPNWPLDDISSSIALPKLLEPHPFEPERSVDLYFHDPNQISLAALRKAAAANTQCIGDLIFGFFEYFAWQFDYRDHVVSIRDPRRAVSKQAKAEFEFWPHHSKLSVEDPFEPWYDVAHVVKAPKFAQIRLEFMRAHHILVTLHHTHNSLNQAVDYLLKSLCAPE